MSKESAIQNSKAYKRVSLVTVDGRKCVPFNQPGSKPDYRRIQKFVKDSNLPESEFILLCNDSVRSEPIRFPFQEIEEAEVIEPAMNDKYPANYESMLEELGKLRAENKIMSATITRLEAENAELIEEIENFELSDDGGDTGHVADKYLGAISEIKDTVFEAIEDRREERKLRELTLLANKQPDLYRKIYESQSNQNGTEEGENG